MPRRSPPRQPTCLFFARVADPDLLELIEFYREDIETLRSLGYTVTTATRNWQVALSKKPTIAYCWWHSTALPAVIVMRLRRVPVVVTGATHFQDLEARSARNTIRVVTSRITARLATTNIAISQSELADLTFLPESRRVVVPLSIDTDFYYPGNDFEPETAITVAQLNPGSIRRKGIDVAILAVPLIARHLSRFRLHVVGPLTPEGAELLEELLDASDRSRVVIHGEVDRARKRELLQASECYLQMSTFEGFGLSAAEALACGVPVVHSGRGSLDEVIGAGGVRVENRSPEGLAEAVVSLSKRMSSDTALRQRAREQALSMSRPARADRLDLLLRGLIR